MQNIYTPTHKAFATEQLPYGKRGDELLLATAIFLTIFGLVMVYSASWLIADNQGSDWSILFRQMSLLGVAVGALLIGMFLNVQHYYKVVNASLAIIIMVLVYQQFFGPEINHTHRWLVIGSFRLQTSEVARILLIIFLARQLTDNPMVVRRLDKNFGVMLSIVAIPIALTALQPDLSSSATMAIIVGLLLFLGGIKIFYLIGVVGIAGISMSLLTLVNSYQRQRLVDFIQSWIAGENSYHMLQSKIGFGRGGIFGTGLGDGKQKLLFLPEPHTDFIFSIIGEELGLIGTVLLLCAFLFLFFRAIRICKLQQNRFAFLLCSGLAGSMMLYALVHMSVTVGIVPLTGLPLPFISVGGTSLLVTLWSIGVLWNLSRRHQIESTDTSETSDSHETFEPMMNATQFAK